jgi:glycerophosphoryl diester phosphodiesterase
MSSDCLPAIQAHRGASGAAPENTLAAFRAAIRLGADGMEMDLQLTRDGAVVVIHDDTLDRTTDRRGRVTDLTLAEIKAADAGVKFGARFRGERVPTLDEVIALVGAEADARFRVNLEIKFGHGREGVPVDVEERVLSVLRTAGFIDRVWVQSFHHPSPATVKALEPRIRTGLLVGNRNNPSDPVARVRQYRADYYAPAVSLLTPELIARLHAEGIPVVTWTVNDAADARRLIDWGVGALAGDAIVSDRPEQLLALKQQH